MSNDSTNNHLDPEFIRASIANRCAELAGSCSGLHDAHVSGIIRGLLWALKGKDPGNVGTLDGILEAAEIPFAMGDSDDGPTVDISAEWLSAHGLDEDWNFLPPATNIQPTDPVWATAASAAQIRPVYQEDPASSWIAGLGRGGR
jgi:hypothetical protein